MSNNIDDWEDVETVDQGVDDWEDVPTEESPTKTESFFRGGAAGLTFDFADELAGLSEAAYKQVTGEDRGKDFWDKYRQYQTESEEKYKAAQEEHPGTYLTGELVGGIAPGIATGGAGVVAGAGKVALKETAKAGAKAGAKFGALSGLGRSEAELTKGEVGEAAKDVGIGAGLGAGMGVVIPSVVGKMSQGIKAFGRKLYDINPSLAGAVRAGKYTKKGIPVLGESTKEQIQQEVGNITETELIPTMLRNYKVNSKTKELVFKMTDKLKNSKKPDKELGELEKAIRGMKTVSDDISIDEAAKDKKLLLSFINAQKQSLKKVTESGQEQAMKRAELAHKRVALELEQDVAGKSAEAQIKRQAAQQMVKDPALKVTPIGQETVEELGERVKTIALYDAEKPSHSILTKAVQNKDLSPIKIDKAKKLVFFVNKKDGKVQSFPFGKDVIEEISGKAVPKTPRELSAAADVAYEKMELMKTSKGKKAALDIYKKYKEMTKESLGDPRLKAAYEKANKKMTDTSRAFEIIGEELKSTKEIDQNKAIDAVTSFFERLGREGGGGDKDLKKWKRFIQKVQESNPELAESITPRVQELAERFELNRSAMGIGFGKYAGLGSFSGATIQAGALVGKVARGVKSAAKSLKDTGVKYSGASTVGHLSKEALEGLSQKHAKSNPRLSQFFKNVSEIDSPTRKRALLFSASQNPALRESIQKIFKKDKE